MSAVAVDETVLARVDELERELRALRTLLAPAEAAAHVDSKPEAEDLLLCRARERTLAVALTVVSEVLPAARLMDLPDADASVLGALNLRGAPLVVYDLAQRLGEGRSPLTRTDLILACDTGGRRLGLKVAAAMDVVHAEVTTMSGDVASDLDGSLLRGAFVHGGEQVVVLDVAAISGAGRRSGEARG